MSSCRVGGVLGTGVAAFDTDGYHQGVGPVKLVRIKSVDELPALVKLAAHARPGERKYILFAGAGLSLDAGLPTAWGLMLATVKYLRASEQMDGVTSKEELDKTDEIWFNESKFAKYTYSQLIGGIYQSPVSQQDFMRSQLKADQPGKAHRLVAELARRNVLRSIITTNFDDLLEKALVEVGIQPQTIANADDLRFSEPLIHCQQFRIYKPHGTLGIGRIRNTPVDLQKLHPRMERELIRITRDHGLMVVGYAGMDEGIRQVFRKRRQSHYPTFWINPNAPDPEIPPLFQRETFIYVKCVGASSAFDELLNVHGKLASLAAPTGIPATVLDVREAIRAGMPGAKAKVREFFKELHDQLKNIEPDYSIGGEADDLLVDALEKTKGLCVNFASVAAEVASSGSQEHALALLKGFEAVVEEYHPISSTIRVDARVGDFWKFVGHELFVMFIASLMRDADWAILPVVLDEPLVLARGEDYRSGVVKYEKISQRVQLLVDRLQRLGLTSRWNLRSDLLNARHTDGELAKSIPAEEFMAADFFLLLRSEIAGQNDQELPFAWFPWSLSHLGTSTPKFLMGATNKRNAETLRKAVGAKDIAVLREYVEKLKGPLPHIFCPTGNWHPFLFGLNTASIGTA